MSETTSTAEVSASVDLSQLLTFNVGFGNLEVVLRNILTRLDAAEAGLGKNRRDVHDEAEKSAARDAELSAKDDELNGALEEERDVQRALSDKCTALENEIKDLQNRLDGAVERAADADRRIEALERRPSAAAVSQPTAAASPSAPSGAGNAGDLDALRRRVEALETGKADQAQVDALGKALQRAIDEAAELKAAVAATNAELGALTQTIGTHEKVSRDRDDDLARRISALAETRPPAVSTARASSVVPDSSWMEPVAALKAGHALHGDQIELLQSKLAALISIPAAAAAPVATTTGGAVSPPEVTLAQFLVLQASVSAMERRPLPTDYADAIRDIQASIVKLNDEIMTLGNECSKNSDACQRLEDRKANKTDLETLLASQSKQAVVSPRAAAPSTASDHSAGESALKGVGELNRRLDELQRLLGTLDGRVRGLDTDKADRRLAQATADEVAALKAQLQALVSAAAGGNKGDAAAMTGAEKAIVDEVQKQVGSLMESQAKQADWTKTQVLEIRATIEHIHHTKADTALVANKAERDFVENSLEKLMREVEQVLNATNAGLIDTLDKSLNILRDMIDGKATKQDVIKLQSMIGEEQLGSVPEGLTGYKGYRCLGCNRALDGMRQRPMGANFATFMNRLPNGARPPGTPSTGAHPSSAQGPRITGPSPPAGYIAGTPQSQ